MFSLSLSLSWYYRAQIKFFRPAWLLLPILLPKNVPQSRSTSTELYSDYQRSKNYSPRILAYYPYHRLLGCSCLSPPCHPLYHPYFPPPPFSILHRRISWENLSAKSRRLDIRLVRLPSRRFRNPSGSVEMHGAPELSDLLIHRWPPSLPNYPHSLPRCCHPLPVLDINRYRCRGGGGGLYTG